MDLDIILHPQGPVDVLGNMPKLQVFQSFTELQDKIDHCQVVTPLIPHPRMNDRHFVLYPLQDIHPDFVHPTDQTHIQKLIKNLDPPMKYIHWNKHILPSVLQINPCTSK